MVTVRGHNSCRRPSNGVYSAGTDDELWHAPNSARRRAAIAQCCRGRQQTIVMYPNHFPLPIHVLSDGDPLHAVVVHRLTESYDAKVSADTPPHDASQPDPSQPEPPLSDTTSAERPAKGSRATQWAARQLQLDGPAGLLRETRAKAKPAMRYAYAKATAGHTTRATRQADESFMRLLGIEMPTTPVALPPVVGTLITFSDAARSAIRPDVEIQQELRVHLGWPSRPGREGVTSALTHRNVDAICVVIEAIGPTEGFAVAHPPLGRDDSPDRIHQRLVALAADMVDQLIRTPSILANEPAPPRSVTTALVDRGAVDRDMRSGRLREVINSVTRF